MSFYKCSSGLDWHKFRIELSCEACGREEDTTIKRRCHCNDRWLSDSKRKGTTLKNNGVVACIQCKGKVHSIFFCCEQGRGNKKSEPVPFTRKTLTVKVTNWDK